MRKYLFLLFLFLIYIICIFTQNTSKVSNEILDDYGVVSVFIKYNNGVNCFELKKVFDNYNDSYYITNFNINKNDNILVSCSDFNKCINDIYTTYDSSFETKYIASGFKINSVSFLAYKDNIEKYLSKYNVAYKIY